MIPPARFERLPSLRQESGGQQGSIASCHIARPFRASIAGHAPAEPDEAAVRASLALMPTPADSRKRVLLFAEAVTLAHVARPLCFARALDRSRYEVAIAVAPHAAPHVAAAGIEHQPVDSIEPRRFLAALARGRALYDDDTLQRYLESDLAVIDRFAPDVVVGDFRLSLSVSARLAQVPYVNIASAYWSPYYACPGWPVPSLPLTRYLPLGLAQVVFSAARPAVFALHSGPLNRVRARHGLPPLPRDLRCTYTDADIVAYSDLPELFPLSGAPATHRFLGPVLWQPAGEAPEWWDHLPNDRPCVYVTLGSSGDGRLLPRIVEALAPLRVTLMVAGTAPLPFALPSNVFAAPYLPGLLAAQCSRLVVCNGGSLTAYQALAAGVPVLGIAGNLDQFLNMQALERAGVGRTLRADRFTSFELRTAVEATLGGSGHTGAVERLSHAVAVSAFDARVAALIRELVG